MINPHKVNAYMPARSRGAPCTVIVAGRMPYPDLAEEVLQAGQADFISLAGRTADRIMSKRPWKSERTRLFAASPATRAARRIAVWVSGCISHTATGMKKGDWHSCSNQKKVW
jgi:hypothetical protein